jgi:hypothetical protein
LITASCPVVFTFADSAPAACQQTIDVTTQPVYLANVAQILQIDVPFGSNVRIGRKMALAVSRKSALSMPFGA